MTDASVGPSARIAADRIADAVTLLRQIVAPCEGADEHSWRKCKRCAAVHGVEERFSLSVELLQVAIDQLAAIESLKRDSDWRYRWHDRLGRGKTETEGKFYERLEASESARAAAEAEVTRLRALTTWQPIETAPKDARAIVGCDWSWRVHPVFWSVARAEWVYCADGYHAGSSPRLTHWQPLPAPPSEETR